MWVVPEIFLYIMHMQTREGTLLSRAPFMLVAATEMDFYKLTIQGYFKITQHRRNDHRINKTSVEDV
jgi:hypothetical protein